MEAKTYDLQNLADEYAAAQALLAETQNFHFPQRIAEVLERCKLPDLAYAQARLEQIQGELKVPYEWIVTTLLNAYGWEQGWSTLPVPKPLTLRSPDAFDAHLISQADARLYQKQLLRQLARAQGLEDEEATALHQVIYQLARYWKHAKARQALWRAVYQRLAPAENLEP